jgi:hypothetical protein
LIAWSEGAGPITLGSGAVFAVPFIGPRYDPKTFGDEERVMKRYSTMILSLQHTGLPWLVAVAGCGSGKPSDDAVQHPMADAGVDSGTGASDTAEGKKSGTDADTASNPSSDTGAD